MQDSSRAVNLPLLSIALLVVSAVWGSTFVVMKKSFDTLNVNSFLSWRFIIATLALILLRPKALRSINKDLLIKGVVAGLFLGGGYIFQNVGLSHTSVSKTGFITGLYVVATPVIAALVLKRTIGALRWISVVIATLGLLLLSFNGLSIGFGESLVFISAILFGAHIVALGEWSVGREIYALTIVQLGTCAVLTSITAAATGFQRPHTLSNWVAIVYSAIFATALAFIFQTWAQSLMPATTVAVILTMEVVFAALFGILFNNETLTPRVGIGGGLVLLSMYLIVFAEGRVLSVEG
jgi:drug/metabolite transporter (DMT)-like permease